MSLAAFIPILGPLIDKLVDRIPDPNERAREKQRIESELLAAATAQQSQQAEINKVEAASADPYTSRWRPTIGYVVGAALAFHYILNPLILWGAALFGSDIQPPNISLDDHLWELILGMLGLAGWRTLDKVKAGAK